MKIMFSTFLLSSIFFLACSSKEAPKGTTGSAGVKDCEETDEKADVKADANDPFAFKLNEDCLENKTSSTPTGTSSGDFTAVIAELRDISSWSYLAQQQFQKHDDHRKTCQEKSRAHFVKDGILGSPSCSLTQDLAMDTSSGTACGKLNGNIEDLATAVGAMFKEKLNLNAASEQRYKDRVTQFYNEGYIRFSCGFFAATGRPVITFMREMTDEPGSLKIEFLVSSQDKDNI